MAKPMNKEKQTKVKKTPEVTSEEEISETEESGTELLDNEDKSKEDEFLRDPSTSPARPTKKNKKGKKSEFVTAKLFQKAIELAIASLAANRRNITSDETGDIRIVPEADRLVGRKNYKTWKKMVDLDLCSYNLIECVRCEDGDPEWTESKIVHMKARAQRYLNNAVSTNIKIDIINCKSAFEAMAMIKADFGENDTQDAMDLYRSLMNLKF